MRVSGWAWLALVCAACGGEGRLVVELRTDYLPGREFSVVELDVTTDEGTELVAVDVPRMEQIFDIGVSSGDLGALDVDGIAVSDATAEAEGWTAKFRPTMPERSARPER